MVYGADSRHQITHSILGVVTECRVFHHLLLCRCLWLAAITGLMLHFGHCIGHMGIMRCSGRPKHADAVLRPQIVQRLVQLQLHVHAAHVARHIAGRNIVSIAQQHLVGIVAGM